MTHAEMLVAALLLDALLGDPPAIWSRLPHPVVLMGRAIAALDRALNRGRARRTKGALAMLALGGLAGAIGWTIAALPDSGLLETLFAAILLAQGSLIAHVRAVSAALARSPEAGRAAVARIVGRDTQTLDESGVARAAVESAAESFADGLVAPAFWFLLFGLPGLMLHKLANTADSMIGHRDARYEHFGWAAARLDDLLNWLPARLAGGLIALASLRRAAFQVMRADAAHHASPNAGWPEAAMAGALGIALAGPRSYEGVREDLPWMNAGARRRLTPRDIDGATTLLWRGWAILAALLALAAAISQAFPV
ncbi:MAG TPA: adenosylcobinamide-phosphate synthase CbiB [Paracoccaceae bacterium]|nr:adenosylcobinamide-phosphate synthase CbiB [Paracoccaceae bacterium]